MNCPAKFGQLHCFVDVSLAESCVMLQACFAAQLPFDMPKESCTAHQKSTTSLSQTSTGFHIELEPPIHKRNALLTGGLCIGTNSASFPKKAFVH